MAVPELRPLGVGEVLDVAIKIYRRHFTTLLKVVAVVVVPVAILGAVVQLSVLPDGDDTTFESGPLGVPDDGRIDEFPSDDVGDPLTEEDLEQVDFGALFAPIAAALVVAALGAVATQIASAASFKAVSEAYLGSEPSWRDSLRFAVGRWRSLLWLTALLGITVVAGALLCILPGVYLYGAFAVAVPVLLLEDIRGRRALGRSRALVRGRWWPVFGVIVLGAILAAVIGAAISGVLLAAAFGTAGDNDIVAVVLNGAAQVLSSVLTTPFQAALVTVLYVDLRVRKEGFDIELLARQMGTEAVVTSPFVPPAPGPLPAPEGDEPPFWPPPPGWTSRSDE